MSKVIVRINPKTGDIEFEVNGIKGAGCKDITNILKNSWTVYEEKDKPELYEELELPDYVENM